MNKSRHEFCIDVSQDAEGFYVQKEEGIRNYIRLGAANVRSFHTGWAPLFLYSGFPGLYLLELGHESGRRCTWFLDKCLGRLCDKVVDLPPPFDQVLRTAAFLLHADIWTQLMFVAVPSLQQRTREFFRVNEATRDQVLAVAQACGSPATAMVDISRHEQPTLCCHRSDGNVVLQRDYLEAIIRASVKEKFIDACVTGTLTWPSPVDGAPMQLLGGIFFDDFRFGYRMIDRRTGLVVVVLISEHHERTLGLFLPQAGIIVVPNTFTAQCLEANFGGLVPSLERHLWSYTLALESYFGAEGFVFASLLRGEPGVHLGHQLWNELGPLEEVVRTIPPGRLPMLLVPNANLGTEIYGPLDALFPEFAARVLRFDHGVAQIIPTAYALRLCVMRITDIHVSATLRSRILAFANASDSGRKARAAAEAISSGGRPLILIGLRVENRTLVDLPGFIISLIERTIAQIGPAVFILDGHNRRREDNSESMFRSFAELESTTRPQEVERQLVSLIEARFAGTNAYIVSTVGASIPASLVWSSFTHFFFAVWGAGLAKYRWVTNTPGFVITSAFNLLHRQDLHIYDDARYMDDPSPLHFPDPALVTDRLDQGPLIDPGAAANPYFRNFDVSIEALWPQIGTILKSLDFPNSAPPP